MHLPVKAIQNEVERSSGLIVSVRSGGFYYSERDGSECAHGDSVESVVMGYLESPNLVELGVQPKVINLLQVRTANRFEEVRRS